MAKINIILRQDKQHTDGTHPVVLRVTHSRTRKYITLGEDYKGFNCYPDQWDKEKCEFKPSYPDFKRLNPLLHEELVRANRILLTIEEERSGFTFDRFERDYRRFTPQDNLWDVFQEEIDRLTRAKRFGYCNMFRYTSNALKAFDASESLTLRDINYRFLNRFEAHLRSHDVKNNTIFLYMRTLRTLFNIAIRYGYIKEEHYPFLSRNNPNGYSLRGLKEKTTVKSLTKEQMFKIRDLDLEDGCTIYHDRNYFMFSYYCRGMNFRDMANLKWTDISDGRLRYVRAKTGRKHDMELLEPAKKILKFYKKYHTSSYVFPILNDEIKDPEKIYKRISNASHRFNENLKIIAKKLDFPPLSGYTARDSYANVLRNENIPIGLISNSMGHQTIKQTEEYFERLPNELVDKANQSIL